MPRKSNKTVEPKTEAAKTAVTAPAAKEEVKAAAKIEAAPAKEVPAKDEVKAAVKEAPAEKKPAGEKKPAAKKTAAAKKPAAKTTADKPAAKKTAAKTTVPAKAAKPEAKAAAKPAVKTAKAEPAKAEPAKRGGRKPKELTVEDICAKLTKKAAKAKYSKLSGTIAAEFKIYGWENNDENHKFIYIEIKDGKLTVAPYDYDDCTFKADIPLADIAAFADGKLALMDAKIYAAGNFGDALKIASIFE